MLHQSTQLATVRSAVSCASKALALCLLRSNVACKVWGATLQVKELMPLSLPPLSKDHELVCHSCFTRASSHCGTMQNANCRRLSMRFCMRRHARFKRATSQAPKSPTPKSRSCDSSDLRAKPCMVEWSLGTSPSRLAWRPRSVLRRCAGRKLSALQELGEPALLFWSILKCLGDKGS